MKLKNILFENSKDSFLGDLTSIKADFTFKKDTYYPVLLEWEASFINENNEVTQIKQSGNYENVNQLDEIIIQDEIKNIM